MENQGTIIVALPKRNFMGWFEDIFGNGKRKHTEFEKRLMEIIRRQETEIERLTGIISSQEKEAEKQNFRIHVLEEHLWKCRHPKPKDGVTLDVVF